MALRFTLGFRVAKYSWTEAHDNNVNYSVGSAQAVALAQTLGGFRVAILSAPAAILYIRISNIPGNKQVYDYYPPYSSLFGAQSFGGLPVSTVKGTMSQVAGLGLLVELAGSNSSTRVYLAGCPSAIFYEPGYQGQGYDLSQVTGYQQVLGNYFTQLIALGFGWYSRTAPSFGTKAAGQLVTNAAYPGAVGVVLPGNLPFNTAPGTALVPSGWRRLSTRSPGLSGVYYQLGQPLVATGPPATTTYFLANTADVQPSNFYTIGSLRVFASNFTNYVSYEIIGATTRKRGARFGAPRGRSTIRS